MAMGKAVIATPEAYEGLAATPGQDLIVATDESSFAAATIDLLSDPRRALKFGCSARRCVERNYSWRANLGPLDAALVAAAPVGASAD
jgi:glycosyltransferase involved in cell wall biosynthesis